MYDPTIGRWTSGDPSGFAAGDSNLYRYAGNKPTNSIDPSGLIEVAISDLFPARISFSEESPHRFSQKARNIVQEAFAGAAIKIQKALPWLENWEETTRRFRFQGGGQVQSEIWARINRDRVWLLRSMRRVLEALKSANTVIRVENHHVAVQGVPMVTLSNAGLFGESNFRIVTRAGFWDLSPVASHVYSQAYWTAHEFGRFFLRLEDMRISTSPFFPGAFGGSGVSPAGIPGNALAPTVWDWDDYIDWLQSRQ